ncbi:molecular chaperone DnaJ [Rathayibacter sp. VKM Ac-2803]|uniref:molecular chaperone DnaJ n=1 Tax=Rathayibacter sp. VKM Ac-2803 TaxID=2609256 RepID=UPI001356AE1A|nr:molecular chaperone DnaJ [Rathayibacter sp. VKM Ac-2803]MWV50083.1 molecular chaperone DnaJ [Rathayibacter sp. VKM Ac-2803]
MTAYWPDELTVAPIGEWPGLITPDRRTAPFRASWTDTLKILRRELTALDADDVILQVAISAAQFRIDGRPRRDARADHPGIILTLTSIHGPLSYPCDTFTTWQDNVRAIALALEALRKVDRYGVTKRGEQYRGFLALESTTAPGTRHVMEFSTTAGAADWLDANYGEPGTIHTFRELVRRAKRATHPDLGGDPIDFHNVAAAEARIRAEGRL